MDLSCGKRVYVVSPLWSTDHPAVRVALDALGVGWVQWTAPIDGQGMGLVFRKLVSTQHAPFGYFPPQGRPLGPKATRSSRSTCVRQPRIRIEAMMRLPVSRLYYAHPFRETTQNHAVRQLAKHLLVGS